MKKTILALLAALVIGGTTATAQEGTLIHRIDMSRGSDPYHTTAIMTDRGWEFWAFGSNSYDLIDLEFGRLYPIGSKLLVGGYAVYWPSSKKFFALPWATYSDQFLGGTATINMAAYLPVNGGPRILFSDSSSLMWQDKRGNAVGLSASYWQFDRDPATLRVGPAVSLRLNSTTTLKLSYQSAYLIGDGQPVGRAEFVIRF